uniref:Heme oxygenase 2a n=1 Tax=Sinocyclocheilus anshuiensis TaxID=1608454 RepID=A0A671L1D9_9TELE
MKAADSTVSNRGENILAESDDDILSHDDLSEVLTAGTKESHDKAENSPFVKDFLRRRIKREPFKVSLVFMDSCSLIKEPIVKRSRRTRTTPYALAKDLEYLYGEDWESKISCFAATQPYVDRIHEVGRDDPVLLVAHAWTHYMGDLSGGQILKKVAQRALKLPPTGEGVNFYHFEGIHNPTAFKRLYRSRMNELDVVAETKKKLLDKANLALKYNLDVFTELQKIGKGIKEEVQDTGFHAHGDMGGDISKCPYYAAKMAVSGNTTYACNFAKMLLCQSTVQVILATWVAAVAGLAAWYLM